MKNILNSTSLLLLAILIFGALLRFYGIGESSVWLDESSSLLQSETLSGALRRTFHPPVHYVLLHVWVSIFGDSATSARSLFALIDVLSIILVYLIAMGLFKNRLIAFIAAALYSIMPHAIWFSREIRSYALWICFYLVSLWAALGFLEKNFSRWRLLAYWVFSIFAVFTHYYAVFYMFANSVFVFFLLGDKTIKKNSSELKKWGLIHLPFIVAFIIAAINFHLFMGLSLIPNMLRPKSGMESWEHIFAALTDFHVIRIITNLTFYTAKSFLQVSWINFALLFALLVCGFILLRKDKKTHPKSALILLISLLLPIVLIVFLPIRNDRTRYFSPSVPIITIILSYTLFSISTFTTRRISQVSFRYVCPFIAAIITIALLFRLFPFIQRALWHEHKPWNQVCQLVSSLEEEGDVIIFSEPHMKKPFSICYKGKAKVYGSPVNKKYRVDPDRLLRLIKNSNSAWLIYAHVRKRNRKDREKIGETLKSQFYDVKGKNFGAIRLWRFEHRR